MALKIEKGDITKYEVDAIVNAANSSLLGGGGVDGAIHRAAGPDLLSECRTLRGCSIGQAKITKGYKLNAKYVIHTVGPIYDDSEQKRSEMFLNACYKNSIKLAVENGCKSLAFTLISAGVYGYPKYEALKIAVSNIEKYASELEVYLVLFDNEAFEIAKETFPEYFGPLSNVERRSINLFARYYGYDCFEQEANWNGYKVYHIWNKRQEGACVGYPKFALEVNGELRLATHEEVLVIMQIRRDRKFTYNEQDAAGCTIQSPDLSEFKGCLYNNEETTVQCYVYKEMKPSSVIYDKKTCDKKRIK